MLVYHKKSRKKKEKNLRLIVPPTHLLNKGTRTVKKSHWSLLQMAQMSGLEMCQFVLERVNKET